MSISTDIDLAGKGGEWAEGAPRQQATASELLERYATGRTVQLLADEVGMGKTYVALAVAASLLLGKPPGGRGRVLVLTPGPLLEQKWAREVREFKGQLLTPDATSRIRLVGRTTDRPNDKTTLAHLSQRVQGLEIVVARYGPGAAGTLTAGLPDRALAHAAAALCDLAPITGWKRWLRHAFPLDDETPSLTSSIGALRNHNHIVWIQGEARSGRSVWETTIKQLQSNEVAQERSEVSPLLERLARAGYMRRIPRLDLVVVDEAHRWVNGKFGMAPVATVIFPRAAKALALTATPLQLDTSNFTSVLRPFEQVAEGADHRPKGWPELEVVQEALASSDAASQQFRRQWSLLAESPPIDPQGRPELAADHPFGSATDHLAETNENLEAVLRPWFIRHRRRRDHRWVFVGHEMPAVLPDHPSKTEPHQLHAADGFPSGQAEVAQLALMRLGALAAHEIGKPTLAAAMTGCFSTAVISAKEVKSIAAADKNGVPYIRYLETLARHEKNGRAIHPKLLRTVDLAEDAWLQGEKVLVFCFRKRTADVLADLIDRRLRPHGARDQASLARALRGDLTPATLDRPAQSLFLAGLVDQPPWKVADAISRPLANSQKVAKLAKKRANREELAEVNALANSLAACWLLQSPPADPRAAAWLDEVASEIDWDDFEWGPPIKPADLDPSSRSVLYGPSVLFGPLHPGRGRAASQRRAFSQTLWDYGAADSELAENMTNDREEILDVLRRHLSSTTTLARLVGRLSTAGGRVDVLMESVAAPYGRRSRSAGESLLQRFTAFVSSLQAMSQENRHQQLMEMAKQESAEQTVALVKGGATTKAGRIFRAFNSPFTPDVLVCTEVGDEGIDLHQFCRIVIHYDLRFNPARVEQRTGRCDRIGSKAAREDEPLLVVLPLLAGSYDERIYARLLQRDQMNEALIGDLSFTSEPEEVGEHGEGALVSLPPALFERLRPDFAICVQ